MNRLVKFDTCLEDDVSDSRAFRRLFLNLCEFEEVRENRDERNTITTQAESIKAGTTHTPHLYSASIRYQGRRTCPPDIVSFRVVSNLPNKATYPRFFICEIPLYLSVAVSDL